MKKPPFSGWLSYLKDSIILLLQAQHRKLTKSLAE